MPAERLRPAGTLHFAGRCFGREAVLHRLGCLKLALDLRSRCLETCVLPRDALGSTLNRHLWDVATLIEEVEFAYDGGPLEAGRFAMYERRYQECLRRIPEPRLVFKSSTLCLFLRLWESLSVEAHE